MPTVTAISTSQDLQWLVQPTLISSMAQSQPPPGQQMPPQQQQPPTVDPYDLPGTSYSTPGMSAYAAGPSPAPVAPAPQRSTRARPRRVREETVSREECRALLLLWNFLWGLDNEVSISTHFAPYALAGPASPSVLLAENRDPSSLWSFCSSVGHAGWHWRESLGAVGMKCDWKHWGE